MKNRLKALRMERKWTQAFLATQLAVSRQTVNALERGKYDPSLPLAFRIAHLFAARIEDIFTPDEVTAGAWMQPVPEGAALTLEEVFSPDPLAAGVIGMVEGSALGIGEVFTSDGSCTAVLMPPGAPDPAILN
jgi:putative transcriptional regulator